MVACPLRIGRRDAKPDCLLQSFADQEATVTDTYTLIITDTDGKQVTYNDVSLASAPVVGAITHPLSEGQEWKPFRAKSVEGKVVLAETASDLGA